MGSPSNMAAPLEGEQEMVATQPSGGSQQSHAGQLPPNDDEEFMETDTQMVGH